MLKAHKWYLLVTILVLPSLAGCAKLALRFSPSLVANMMSTFFEECDPELAKDSLPAELKLLEGLLKNDPGNKHLLTALCMGFSGYSMLFVEDEDPHRASRLYYRAMNYGFRRLGLGASFLKDKASREGGLRKSLDAVQDGDLEALFWLTVAWNAWVNLNLDKPAALVQLGMAQACLDRVLEMNGAYFYGTPYVLLGSILAARPAVLGGDPVKARSYFEKAMRVSEGKFFLVQYYYAKYYAVRSQNKALFTQLLQAIVGGSPGELGQVCLINAVMAEKGKRLLEASNDLFI
jgi:hypothetical protein